MANLSKLSAEGGAVRFIASADSWEDRPFALSTHQNHEGHGQSNSQGCEEIANAREETRVDLAKYIKACTNAAAVPDGAFNCLLNIYLAKIHPFFPIFPRGRLAALVEKRDDHNAIDHLVKLAICLSAASDTEATQHLVFKQHRGILPYTTFVSRIGHLISIALDNAKFDAQMCDKIRIQTLTALFWHPQHSTECDYPTDVFSRAVSLVFRLGLHRRDFDEISSRPYPPTPLDSTKDPLVARARRSEENECLFLCVYVADRLLACTYGQPTLINKPDALRNVEWPPNNQPTCFRLLVRLIKHLDSALLIYRPPTQGSSSTYIHCNASELPPFESIITDTRADIVLPPLVETLEVLYHAIEILSFRDGRPPPSGNDIYLEVSGEHIRARRAAAVRRILHIHGRSCIICMPWVPYALSLALASSFRIWRDTTVAAYRDIGRKLFQDTVMALDPWAPRSVISSAFHRAGVDLLDDIQAAIARLTREWDELSLSKEALRSIGMAEPPLPPPQSIGAVSFGPSGSSDYLVLRVSGPDQAEELELRHRASRMWCSPEARLEVSQRDGSTRKVRHLFEKESDAIRDGVWCKEGLREPPDATWPPRWHLPLESCDFFSCLPEKDIAYFDSIFYAALIPTFPLALEKGFVNHIHFLDTSVWPTRTEPRYPQRTDD